MTYQLPTAFIDKYNEEVKLRAQQRKRRLAGLSNNYGTFKGDYFYVPRFGQVTTYSLQRLQELALANKGIDWLKKNCAPEFVAFGLWDPDKDKITIDMAGQFADATVKAVDRAQDRQHVDALNDAAANGVTNTNNVTENIVTIGDYNTVAGLETIAEAITELGSMEMFEDEEVSVIAPFKLRVQNSLDPYMAKTDVKQNTPWNEVNWRSYERLPGNGTGGVGWLRDIETGGATDATGVDIYVHAKSAVASMANTNPTEINERLGSRLGDMIGRWFQASALVVEPKGLIRIKSKLDFDLFRPAVPVEDVG
jgi:hypothetical protein